MADGFAPFLQPAQHFHRSVERNALLIASDQQAYRSLRPSIGTEIGGQGCGECGNCAFHIGGATAKQEPVLDLGTKRIVTPEIAITGRHDIGMTRETEMRIAGSQPGIEIFHRRGILVLKAKPVAGKAQRD